MRLAIHLDAASAVVKLIHLNAFPVEFLMPNTPTRRELDEWLAPQCYPDIKNLTLTDEGAVTGHEDSPAGARQRVWKPAPTHSLDVVWRARRKGSCVMLMDSYSLYWPDGQGVNEKGENNRYYRGDGEPAYALGMAIWEAGQ